MSHFLTLPTTAFDFPGQEESLLSDLKAATGLREAEEQQHILEVAALQQETSELRVCDVFTVSMLLKRGAHFECVR